MRIASRPRWPIWRQAVGLAGLAMAIGACRDGTVNAPPEPRSARPAPTAISPAVADASAIDDTTANFFAADVEVRSRAGAGPARDGKLENVSRFRVERQRRVDGVWQASYSFDPPANRSATSGGLPPGIARIEMADDGSAPRAFDHAGKQIDFAGLLQTAERARGQIGVDLTKGRPPFAGVPSERPAPAARPAQVHSWLESVVLGPKAREQRRASLERRFGKPTDQVRGLDRYTGVQRDFGLEVLVDPATGLVAEQTMTRGGKVVHRATLGYTRIREDVFVPSSAHVEFPAGPGQAGGQVVDVTISNIRVERRGGF
jgi:hypothetical protein